MVDGFGVPPEGWDNSVFGEYCDRGFLELLDRHSIPLDATLGVEGLPQSATGQTALFTGVNAAALMRSHMQGFPGPELRKVIREDNIFKTLLGLGRKVAFANAYVRFGLKELAQTRLRSVTTVMTEAALGFARVLDNLLDGMAVYHDLTRESISSEYHIPTIKPTDSAGHLLAISSQHDFTLFEYFLTDRAGHAGDTAMLREVLGNFSEFMCALAQSLPDDTILTLCSDHGNCEDMSTRAHTRNPVPFLVYGQPAVVTDGMRSIADVCPFATRFLS